MSNTKIDAAAIERGGEVHRQEVNKYRWWNGAHYETEPLPREEMRERIANVAHGGSFTYAFADELLSLADRYGTSRRPGSTQTAPRPTFEQLVSDLEVRVSTMESTKARYEVENQSLRGRIAQLESDNEYLRGREAHFARVLGVCDGGRYRADWNAAIERVVSERDAALARVKELDGELQEMRADAVERADAMDRRCGNE